MSNLYFKNNTMGCLFKKVYSLKMLLLIFVLAFGFITYSFAQNNVFFGPGNTYPILNSSAVGTSVYLKVTTTAGVESYGVDIFDQSREDGEIDPNNKLTILTNIWKPLGIGAIARGTPGEAYSNPNYYGVFTYNGSNASNPPTFTDQNIGHLYVSNSGNNYLTGVYVDIYTGVNAVTKIDLVGSSQQDYDNISGLNIYFWASPDVKDIVDPKFPNNQTTINTNPNFPNRQTNKQVKDNFTWIFDLLDNTNTALGSNGWINTPDFDAGNNFRPNATNGVDSTITNQNGINSGSFALQIYVASGWDHTTSQSTWNTWDAGKQYDYDVSNGDITLVGQDKTWRWFDKNYSGDITEANMSDFGVEELVMISGYVEDRDMGYPNFDGTQTWNDIKGYSYYSGKNSTNFVYYFNQGMRPWFNQDTQGSYTHDSTCKLDIVQSQTGFVVRTITGYLHDDWAGIDTSTVQVIVTGTISDVSVNKIYTVSDTELTLNNFSFTSNGCRVDGTSTSACTPTTPNSCGNTSSIYPGNGITEVCDDGSVASTGNYQLVLSDLSRSYDPEDEIYVSIVYKDNKGKDGRPVSCDWGVEKAPRFVGTGNGLSTSRFQTYFAGLINLSNHPQGAKLDPINIQLQDDWAGVDTGSIVGSVSGNTLNGSLDDILGENINLEYDTNIYSVKDNNELWNFDNYPNVIGQGYIKSLLNTTTDTTSYIDWLANVVNSVQDFQNLNYELLFDQTNATHSTFTDYFAPEHDINLSLTFKDNDSDGGSGHTTYNPINVTYTNNESIKFWDKVKNTNFVAGTDNFVSSNDTAVGNYLTGEMAKLFSGNAASGENRIFPYDITGDNQAQLGTLKQTDIAFKVTDNWAGVDSGTVIVTITGNRRGEPYVYVFTASNLDFSGFDRGDSGNWNLLNYLVELKNHDIYFDRQSRGSNGPVTGRESRYTILLSGADLKQPDANIANVSFTRDMENLSCKKLDRCNSKLYFTYRYSGSSLPVSPVVQTGVHPFLGQTLYVIASGNQIIYTGVNENYIACNGAGTLGAPLIIDFEDNLLDGNETDPYNNYQYSELYVMDGNFELTGNTLILK